MAKILVADDNSNIQKMVGLALKDQGIDVVAVGNGEAAVRKISDIHPDLVLADVFMPVRNGYEVCKYVKDDPTLAHIPVILLVGAFDPLDEQEAQRVGADGVLKKPFVPPDPLISMVKSALLRAGVPLGNAPVADRPTETPTRKAAEILGAAAGLKHAALGSEKLPEAMPEPAIEEFSTRPEHLKIAAGEGPVAFGSMLETPQVEDDAAFMPPGKGGIAAEHNWGTGAEEEEEEELEAAEEKESAHGGWRPGGLADLDDAALPTPRAPDWREEAFHGSAPANDRAQSSKQIHVAEAEETQAVAVSTLERASADAPVPFTGDAWAAAMAAGIEQKQAEAVPAHVETATTETIEAPKHEEAQGDASVVEESAPVADHPAADEIKPVEPAANAWPSASATPWELEAKKASLLASTWDAPAQKSPEETQEIPPYIAAPLEEPAEAAPEPEAVSAYASETIVEATEHVEASANEVSKTEVHQPESQQPEVQQSEVVEQQEAKISENTWEAPAPPAMVEHAMPAAIEAIVEQVAAVPASQLNMDELVARVLEKMNPDVLQKVTREILKPVIEAIVRDELDSKKS